MIIKPEFLKKNYNTELDFILEELLVAYGNHFKGFIDAFAESHKTTNGETKQKLRDKFQLEEWEINLLYEKLLKDGYIKSLEPLSITHDGLIFRNNGGYIQKNINLGLENRRIQNLENISKKNECWMVVLTAVLAIGTLIASCYYAIELWKYYHPHCHL